MSSSLNLATLLAEIMKEIIRIGEDTIESMREVSFETVRFI